MKSREPREGSLEKIKAELNSKGFKVSLEDVIESLMRYSLSLPKK